jgi:hypothetical protein
MSAFGDRVDVKRRYENRLLLTQSGHRSIRIYVKWVR